MGATIYCICNQKGGCAKTVTIINLEIGFIRKGKHVLLVDVDSQGSMTTSLGWQQPNQIEITLSTILGGIIQEKPFPLEHGILRHTNGNEWIVSLKNLVNDLYARDISIKSSSALFLKQKK